MAQVVQKFTGAADAPFAGDFMIWTLEIVDTPAPSARRLRAARDARAVALVAAVAPDDNAAPVAAVPAAAGEGAGQVLYRGHELATGSILIED